MNIYRSFILFSLCIPLFCKANEKFDAIALQSGIASRIHNESCDTVMEVSDYTVRVIKTNGEFEHIGLFLFSPEMKEAADKRILDFIETSLFAKSQNTELDNSDLLKITNGRIQDFKSLSPDSECNITNIDSKKISVEWNLQGKQISISLPTNYEMTRSGTRLDIEQDFISRLKNGGCRRVHSENINMDNLEPYKNDLYILRRGSYIKKEINRNVYFSEDDKIPVYCVERPIESFANLLLYPADINSNPPVDITVLGHDYGVNVSFTVPLFQLLAVAEEDGCTAFWGPEKYEKGILEGSLFLYNQNQGYDHIIKIECDPIKVVENEGRIKATASLFIPTNNVHDIFAPYIKTQKNKKKQYQIKL